MTLIAGLHLGLGAHQLVEASTPSEVGETFVFTQSDWEKYLAVRVCSPEETAGIATFYLMTDGVADDCTHPPPDDIFRRWARDIDREMKEVFERQKVVPSEMPAISLRGFFVLPDLIEQGMVQRLGRVYIRDIFLLSPIWFWL
ncbi:MAG: protein phosphatase 2C domain-containing protein [Armatimonadetes bacterium]|nr:protein phosphatase 2C domain-containing protein [Armatimonadota bacterium]